MNRGQAQFILSHALFEARLFHRIKQHEAKAPQAYQYWVYSLYGLVFGWLSMVLCLVFDIRSCPREHSVLGGLYGGAWLLGQSIRCAVDDEREKLGLAKAPRLARTRRCSTASSRRLVRGRRRPRRRACRASSRRSASTTPRCPISINR